MSRLPLVYFTVNNYDQFSGKCETGVTARGAARGAALSMTTEVISRPAGLCGVASPYPTVVAVVTAQ
jgi:hypothetical protein